jgi:rSAM/selenodomain-associated transferase 2/rSAM/selenodomain-associated transferase 1
MGEVRTPRPRRNPLETPNRRLIVFTRYPEPGLTKTRLIPVLGPEGAARLQAEMTGRVVLQARRLVPDADLEIRHDGGSSAAMGRWLGSDLIYRPQGEGDVGRRMVRALDEALDEGAPAVVLIGTDCPGVTPALLDRAFDALQDHDLVLGPAADGGYYLVGLSRHAPALFTDMTWGHDRVLVDTLARADRLGLRKTLVDTLIDVDRPDDLAAWEAVRAASEVREPQLSVIVPALNEAARIGPVIAQATAARFAETIVVDGGSLDHTPDIARAYGVRVLETSPGRAGQMNLGAAAARGRNLFFLHGDTRPPPGYDLYIERVLSGPGVAAGAFELGIDGPGPGLRWIEMTANWRSRLAKLPYGDQGLFVSADVFRRTGGFPDLPIMEDFVMIKRLRRLGRIAIAPARVRTSARRWRGYGPARNTVRNQLIVAAFYLGVSPERLARWYYPDRRFDPARRS